MIKVITKPDSNIRIELTNADEMCEIFSRLGGWMDLQVDDDYYPMRCKENNYMSYTSEYFQKKYFDS